MKKISPCLLLIFILNSCSNPQPIVDEKISCLQSELDTFYLGGHLVRVEKIKKADFTRVSSEKKARTKEESYYLEQDSSSVRRSGDTLFFKTENKITSLVNDRSDTDTQSEYSYIGYDKQIGQYLVYGTFYEWFNYILVDKITGDTLLLCGEPIISPDKKRFVVGNSDLQAGLNFNGLEIYSNTHRPVLYGLRSLGQWGPNTIKWLDNSTLLIEGSVFDSTKADLVRTDYFKLSIE